MHHGGMTAFGGEVAEFYQRYRHGYPEAVTDVLATTFGLTAGDTVVDLGCGTGQLALPLARRVRAVLGVDPEPAMLRCARQAAHEAGVPNVTWVLGADTDLPALARLLGPSSVAAVTVGQALHWMRREDLLRGAAALVRPGGGVAVVTNGSPLWLQDTAWSRALRDFLAGWLGEPLTAACGTDQESQRRYATELDQAGLEVLTDAVDYTAELTLEDIVGGVYSALSEDQLPPPAERPDFTARVRRALGPQPSFTERVHVAILAGRKPHPNPITRFR
jgi:ubiquinone/menaquinone biosynthesis C-methylase UbiE